MKGMLEIYGGGTYALPPLLSWEVRLTGGVPCDSFSLTCCCDREMASRLDKAWRLTLVRNGALLRAVVDESEVIQDEKGRRAHISGRGLAALLLDNESEAVEYSAPTLSELLRRHAAPYGLRWAPFEEIRGSTPYGVASSSSQWKAINAFTQYYGGFPLRITPEGVLQPVRWQDPGKRLLIGERTAEDVKLDLASAVPLDDPRRVKIRGRAVNSPIPQDIDFTTAQAAEAIREPCMAILAAIKWVLERTPPELAADIMRGGIHLTGGGAQLFGLDQYIATELGIPVLVAKEPMDCSALGLGYLVENLQLLQSIGKQGFMQME